MTDKMLTNEELTNLIEGLLTSGESQGRTLKLLVDGMTLMKGRIEELEERVSLLEKNLRRVAEDALRLD